MSQWKKQNMVQLNVILLLDIDSGEADRKQERKRGYDMQQRQLELNHSRDHMAVWHAL